MSDDTSPNALECGAALAAAAEWRLLGLLLERPRPGWLEEVESLAREVGASDLRRAAAAAPAARESAYLATFGPGGSVSPREVAYRGREDPGQILSDIAVFHEVFAFRPQVEDSLDQVGVEASFVGYLRLKEAYARAQCDVVSAETSASAASRFVEAHLGCFAEPLVERLAQASAPDHLTLAANALLARTGPVPARYGGALDDDGPCDGELECGGCTPGATPGP